MKIEPALLETWLLKYEKSPYNLGESSVTNLSVGELIKLTECESEFFSLSLENNDTYGSLGLREAIASVYENVTPENILVTAGTTEAILIYYHVRYEPGANVVVPVPAFHILHEIPKYLGYEVRYLPLRRSEQFRPNLAELGKLVDNKTKVIVLNSPHNPTGVVYSSQEIQGFIELAENYQTEILSDEHYRFLPHQQEMDFIPSWFGKSPALVALGSTGKCFGSIGLRIGWLIGSPEIVKACHDLKDYTTHTVSPINDILVKHSLLNWQKILPKYRRWIVKNAISLHELVERNYDLMDWVQPEAGTIAFPFLKTLNSQDFAHRLVQETGVLVLPGEALDCPGHFRIALGVEPDRFQKAINALEQFLQTYALSN